MNTMERHWITAAEAAEILGVPTTEVYRLLDNGALQGARRDDDPRVVVDEATVRAHAGRP